jgi:hypothetical protein
MWPPKQPNSTPSQLEWATLTKLIAQERALVSAIGAVQKESKPEHLRLDSNTTMLRRALDSAGKLTKIGTEILSPLNGLSAELLGLESMRESLVPLVPSTVTQLEGWKTVKEATSALSTAIETQLSLLKEFIHPVARELYSTEMLRDQMANTISSLSGMMNIAEESINSKRNGILHPVRRVPPEILVQIFQYSVEEEANEWLKDISKTPAPLLMATRIARVCKRWRDAALNTPHLWRHVRAPANIMLTTSYSGSFGGFGGFGSTHSHFGSPFGTSTSGTPTSGVNDTTAIAGVGHCQRCLHLCRGHPIELIVPPRFATSPDLDFASIKIDRLNLLNASAQWPPNFPSPLHLWIGEPSGSATLTRQIPSSLISRTTSITSVGIFLTFDQPNNSVERLTLCGRHSAFSISFLLSSLLQLSHLDAIETQFTASTAQSVAGQSITHYHLQYLSVHSTCLTSLERSFVTGLQIPNLRRFTLGGLTSFPSAHSYPSLCAQLRATVVHLGIETPDPTSVGVIRTFIDAFVRLNTVSMGDAATCTVLQALYRPSGPVTGKNKSKNEGYTVPRGLSQIVIHGYKGDGNELHQQLLSMKQNTALHTPPLEFVFKDCLNILPHVRNEFSTA